ncbi:enoyl-CoA hydratase/isomerase family protein [Actinophytocola sp.]|uniref:enoyl-CoA hydratase/isomerase family protein n=1 Tax=Actinophytocola sp. TaxID=1872138 RepID=UPI003D6B3C1B
MTDATGTPPLVCAFDDDRLEITLNRPAKLNALTPDMLRTLAAVLDDPRVADCRLVVLRAAGERAFSAGFDLTVLRELGTSAHEGDPLGAAGAALAGCPVPTVAVLHGYCWGAAVELVASCDLRIARDDVTFAVPSHRLGSVYRPAGIDLVARRFGWTTAVELFLFGLTVPVDTAVSRGVLAWAGPAEEVDGWLAETLDRLRQAGESAATHKRILTQWLDRAEVPAELMSNWELLRAESVRRRTIPAVGGRRHGS